MQKRTWCSYDLPVHYICAFFWYKIQSFAHLLPKHYKSSTKQHTRSSAHTLFFKTQNEICQIFRSTNSYRESCLHPPNPILLWCIHLHLDMARAVGWSSDMNTVSGTICNELYQTYWLFSLVLVVLFCFVFWFLLYQEKEWKEMATITS